MRRRARIIYTAPQMAWLKLNRKMIISDYHRVFVGRFKRADVKLEHLHGLRKRMGWKVGRAKGRFKGRQVGKYRVFSKIEAEWIHQNAKLVASELYRKFCETFKRKDLTSKQVIGLRHRKGWRTGRTGCFPKGHIPNNKGKPFLVAKTNPNCRRNQFKKGQLPPNTKFIGYERVTKDGYVEISVRQKNPHTGADRRFVLKHRLLWEKKNGPVPEGHALKCIDGDKTNTKPSNWQLISRAALPRLAGGAHKQYVPYDQAPVELKPTLLVTAQLYARTRKVSKKRAGRNKKKARAA